MEMFPPLRPLHIMAFSNSKHVVTSSALVIPFLLPMFMILLAIPNIEATTFNFSSFESNPIKINLQGDASSSDGKIDLTTNRRDKALNYSGGRALYSDPIRLWDLTTGKVADFSSRFSFKITRDNNATYGADGMTFFLAPNGTYIPDHSLGGCLGLISNCSKSNSSVPVIAVEFDTFFNEWDPGLSGNDHVGIDVNSINSTAVWDYVFQYNGTTYYVLVDYNSSTRNLSVYVNSNESIVVRGSPNLSYAIDLKSILPQWVNVGFSSATGEAFELHTLLSWQFDSTDFPPPTPEKEVPDAGGGKEGKTSKAMVVGLTICSFLLVGGVCLVVFIWRQKKRYIEKDEEYIMSDMSSDDEFEDKTGPKRFTYSELLRATNNFTEDGKLGDSGGARI